MGVYNDMYKMGAMVIAMSDAMEILYAYAKEELLPSYLPSPEYPQVIWGSKQTRSPTATF